MGLFSWRKSRGDDTEHAPQAAGNGNSSLLSSSGTGGKAGGSVEPSGGSLNSGLGSNSSPVPPTLARKQLHANSRAQLTGWTEKAPSSSSGGGGGSSGAQHSAGGGVQHSSGSGHGYDSMYSNSATSMVRRGSSSTMSGTQMRHPSPARTGGKHHHFDEAALASNAVKTISRIGGSLKDDFGAAPRAHSVRVVGGSLKEGGVGGTRAQGENWLDRYAKYGNSVTVESVNGSAPASPSGQSAAGHALFRTSKFAGGPAQPYTSSTQQPRHGIISSAHTHDMDSNKVHGPTSPVNNANGAAFVGNGGTGSPTGSGTRPASSCEDDEARPVTPLLGVMGRAAAMERHLLSSSGGGGGGMSRPSLLVPPSPVTVASPLTSPSRHPPPQRRSSNGDLRFQLTNMMRARDGNVAATAATATSAAASPSSDAQAGSIETRGGESSSSEEAANDTDGRQSSPPSRSQSIVDGIFVGGGPQPQGLPPQSPGRKGSFTLRSFSRSNSNKSDRDVATAGGISPAISPVPPPRPPGRLGVGGTTDGGGADSPTDLEYRTATPPITPPCISNVANPRTSRLSDGAGGGSPMRGGPPSIAMPSPHSGSGAASPSVPSPLSSSPPAPHMPTGPGSGYQATAARMTSMSGEYAMKAAMLHSGPMHRTTLQLQQQAAAASGGGAGRRFSTGSSAQDFFEAHATGGPSVVVVGGSGGGAPPVRSLTGTPSQLIAGRLMYSDGESSRGVPYQATLTCIKPSTFPSNFAGESQPDFSYYEGGQFVDLTTGEDMYSPAMPPSPTPITSRRARRASLDMSHMMGAGGNEPHPPQPALSRLTRRSSAVGSSLDTSIATAMATAHSTKQRVPPPAPPIARAGSIDALRVAAAAATAATTASATAASSPMAAEAAPAAAAVVPSAASAPGTPPAGAPYRGTSPFATTDVTTSSVTPAGQLEPAAVPVPLAVPIPAAAPTAFLTPASLPTPLAVVTPVRRDPDPVRPAILQTHSTSSVAPLPSQASLPSPLPTSASAAAVVTSAGQPAGQSGAPRTHSYVAVGPPLAAPVMVPAPPPPRFDPALILGHDPSTDHGSQLPGYTCGKVIGEGGFCQVRMGVHHLSQRKVAIKVVDKTKLTDPNEARRMQREIRIMRHLSHECVIKIFEVVDTPTRLYLVMEHAPAGSLLDYVRARKRLAEPDACFFFQQIVGSLQYCHRREVVHRDIKLENILLDPENRMKLIDFGLSAFFVPGKKLRVHCGSPSYAAPEIVARKQYDGPPVDVWSLGIVLFAMVCGYLPFHSSVPAPGNKQDLCNKIMAGVYNSPDYLSSGVKDLLSRMLTVDPDRRITFEQVWQHAWVKNCPQHWEPATGSVYMVYTNSVARSVYLDEQILIDLQAAGYNRTLVAQSLFSGEANHVTASYFLLAEGKVDVIRRLRGAAAARRYASRSFPSGVAPSSSGPPLQSGPSSASIASFAVMAPPPQAAAAAPVAAAGGRMDGKAFGAAGAMPAVPSYIARTMTAAADAAALEAAAALRRAAAGGGAAIAAPVVMLKQRV